MHLPWVHRRPRYSLKPLTFRVWSRPRLPNCRGAERIEDQSRTPKTQLEIAAPCSFRGTKNRKKIQKNLKKSSERRDAVGGGPVTRTLVNARCHGAWSFGDVRGRIGNPCLTKPPTATPEWMEGLSAKARLMTTVKGALSAARMRGS